jgi:Ca-activated chloride channel family protein
MGMKYPGTSILMGLKHHTVAVLVVIYLLVFTGWLLNKYSLGESVSTLFLTQDQRAQMALNRADYKLAANLFEDPLRKGLSAYFSEDFAVAAVHFQELESDEALFNLATAFAHASNYLYSQASYEVLLERNPDYPGAVKNHSIVKAIVDEMLAMGEQQQEGQQQQRSQEVENTLDEDIGEMQMEFGTREPPEQITAEDLMNNPEMAELWMKQVQSDPAEFLSAKFQMQLKKEGQDND